MNRAALLLALSFVILAACNVSKGDGGSNVTINADDGGNVSMNLPFAKANVKLPSGAFDEAHFDMDGVKLMPGATLHGFNVDAGDKGALVHVAFDAPKSPDEVRGYFLDQFKQKGGEATQSGTAIVGKTGDGNQFTIDVQPAAQGSTGTIAIQSKD